MARAAVMAGLVIGGAIVAACGGGDGSGEGGARGGDDDAGGATTGVDATTPSVVDASGAPDSSSLSSDATVMADDGGGPSRLDGGAVFLDSSAPSDAAPDGGGSSVGLASQDVTFFAFGDPQYGGGPADKNSFNIQALNAAPGLEWPTDAGFESTGTIGDPRAVIIAGDLTQNGQSGRDPLNEWYVLPQYEINVNTEYGVNVSVPVIAAELGLFLRDYGLRGNDGLNPFVLKYRVFEGYGNHDFDVLSPDPSADPIYGTDAPARDIVSVRNQVRASWPEMRRFAPGTAGHYSWDWDATHFVHVNLVASDAIAANTQDDSGTQPPRDPQGALTFLQQDLAAEVGSSCRPVVVIMHYGFDPFSEEGRWWDDTQRQAFLKVVRPYNIAAILHGHVHETCAYTMDDGQGKRYDVFSLGSPYYEGQGTNGVRGHFQVFHIKGAHIDAADLSWLPSNPVPGMADDEDLWTGKQLADLGFQITTEYADGWGGWSYSKDIDVASCLAGYPPPSPAPDSGTAFCPPGGSTIDAGSNLLVEQPNPSLGENAGVAFNWDDSWGDAFDTSPDPAYEHMTSALACGGLATSWKQVGVGVGQWLKFFPDNTSQPSGQLYFVASPLVAGQAYTASITLFGSGTYHLNIYDGAGGAGVGDNAGAPVTLDGAHATTLSVPFTMGTGTPEFQLRVDADAQTSATGLASVDVTMWGAAIVAR